MDIRKAIQLIESAGVLGDHNPAYFMNWADDGTVIVYPSLEDGEFIENWMYEQGEGSAYPESPIRFITIDDLVEEHGMSEQKLKQMKVVPQDIINQIKEKINNFEHNRPQFDVDSDSSELVDEINDVLSSYIEHPDNLMN